MFFGRFADGLGQLVDGIGDVVARELVEERQRPRDGLVELDARSV